MDRIYANHILEYNSTNLVSGDITLPREYYTFVGTDTHMYKLPYGTALDFEERGTRPDNAHTIRNASSFTYKQTRMGDESYEVDGVFTLIDFVNFPNTDTFEGEFDVLLILDNEYGYERRIIVTGVEVVSWGSGVSVDDTSCEIQYNYEAESISIVNYDRETEETSSAQENTLSFGW